ncbi:unnamed protein product [Arabidopsis lyrata]|nr:unnamed protein product [Arabidopsis lyrata]
MSTVSESFSSILTGAELYHGKRDGKLHPCKILKIVTTDGSSKPQSKFSGFCMLRASGTTL